MALHKYSYIAIALTALILGLSICSAHKVKPGPNSPGSNAKLAGDKISITGWGRLRPFPPKSNSKPPRDKIDVGHEGNWAGWGGGDSKWAPQSGSPYSGPRWMPPSGEPVYCRPVNCVNPYNCPGAAYDMSVDNMHQHPDVAADGMPPVPEAMH